MKKRNHPRLASPSAISAERSTTTLLYILLTIACAAFLATGFFFAARQHFAAMDLGMKNSTLRKQIEEMEAQNRQLLLAREMVRSPAEMKRIAVNKGFRERGNEILPAAASSLSRQSPLVERTAMVTPSNADRKPVKAFLPRDVRPVNAKLESRDKRNNGLVAINKLR
ncbi:MAG TPA: hypothetical protein VFZ49_08075 [Pyrinomonadaceae bacterium]